MNLKEKLIVLIVLVVSIFVSIGVLFEVENTNNRVYLHSIVEVNNMSIDSLNSKIDVANKKHTSIINEYNDCITIIAEDTDLFNCGAKPQLKIFKKLNKINIKNL